MKDRNEILKHYYQGETTLEEERMLREAFQKEELPDEPVLAFGKDQAVFPPALTENIRQHIHHRYRHRVGMRLATIGGIAATLVLIVSLRYLLPENHRSVQLSDNLKKERFEEALRVIGNVLEEETPVVQKVLYEDHNLIITVE